MKQRVGRRVLCANEEVKAALQEEWDRFTLEEIWGGGLVRCLTDTSK